MENTMKFKGTLVYFIEVLYYDYNCNIKKIERFISTSRNNDEINTLIPNPLEYIEVLIYEVNLISSKSSEARKLKDESFFTIHQILYKKETKRNLPHYLNLMSKFKITKYDVIEHNTNDINLVIEVNGKTFTKKLNSEEKEFAYCEYLHHYQKAITLIPNAFI